MPLPRLHASLAAGAVLLAASVLLAVGSLADAAAAQRPARSVRIATVKAPARAGAGEQLTVRVRLATRARRVVRATLSARLERAGAKAVALAPRRRVVLERGSATATVRPRIPAGTAARAYRLVVCVAANRATRCTTGRKLTVIGRSTHHPCSCVQLPPRPNGDGVAAVAEPGAGATPPAPVPVDFTAAPNPVNVQPAQDVARQVTKTIGPMGGTVEAVGAHGEHYVLTVPEKALLAETAISVTPLIEVDGLPFAGGLVAGAQMAPDGLRFLQPATLTITGAPTVDAEHETGFGYRGDGRDLGLAPMVLDPRAQAFKIMHFSAVGIASGTDAERRALLIRQTSDVESQLGQIAAFEVQMGRTNALTGLGRPMDLEVLAAAFKAYADQVLHPLLDAAMTDDELAPRALGKSLAWLRQAELLLSEELAAERADIWQRILKVAEHGMRRSIQKCLAGDPTQLPLLIANSRQAQLLGLSVADELGQGFVDCASFELDLDTTIDQVRGGEHQPYHGHLLIDGLKITLSGGFALMGAGTFDYPDYSIGIAPHTPGVGCWLGADGWEKTGDALAVLDLDINWVEDVDDGEYHLQEADIAEVVLQLGVFTKEKWIWADCGGSTGQGGMSSWLGIEFGKLHKNPDSASSLPTFREWSRSASGPLVLTHTFDRSTTIDTVPTTEHTVVTVRHAPKVG